MTESETDATSTAGSQQNREMEIVHTGTDTFHEDGRFVDKEVIEVRCEDMDECREVGRVVSLLNEHSAEEIAEAVEVDE